MYVMYVDFSFDLIIFALFIHVTFGKMKLVVFV
jgi:hypothetical protein